MIDIVVTYLNERDEKWQEDYKYWKEKEIQEGKARPDNRQAFGEERIREWDTFKYWFRGIQKNCPWVHKVFLIVQNERHVPEWLNTDYEKVRVVYHDEFIPKEFLPTFNPMTIGMYISNIKDLSDTYIMCDDDFYFLNYIDENRFFIGNKPVHLDNKTRFKYYYGDALKGSDNVFYRILNNNLEFEQRYMKDKVKYGFYHLPSARVKSFEQEILQDNIDEINDRNSHSKFRNQFNLCNYMFDDLLKIRKKAILCNPYYNCSYCTLKSDVDFDTYADKDIVCFNDTEQLDDYNKTKDKLIEFLHKKFPNKSVYEKE